MQNRILTAAAIIGAVMLPLAAQAQQGGAAAGATAGAVGGAIVGGPIGAVVGGVGGFIVGGISDETRPRFRTYVVEQKRPSYAYSSDVVIGAELPADGKPPPNTACGTTATPWLTTAPFWLIRGRGASCKLSSNRPFDAASIGKSPALAPGFSCATGKRISRCGVTLG
jgi:hypothetical protein